MIYLDSAATSLLHPEAKKAMDEAWENWANPSAAYQAGVKNRVLLECFREEFKQIYNIKNNAAVIFTSSATESNNIAFHSSNKPILVERYSHPSLYNFPNIELFDEEHLEEKIKNRSCLVSLSVVNHETGMLMDIEKIAQLTKKYKCLLHLDASQAKVLDFEASAADFMTISSHKMGGPVGTAALIAKPLVKALLYGGGQEYNARPGTQALPLIAGFVKAASLLPYHELHFRQLKALLLEKIDRKFFLQSYVKRDFADHLNCLLTQDRSGSELVAYMDLYAGIGISFGSACNSGALEGIKILERFNFPPENAIRVSFGWHNTLQDIEIFAEHFNEFFLT